jgi:uncharacterized protein (TIGR01777 family)
VFLAPIKLRFESVAAEEPHELYAWHIGPGAFTRLGPAWESVSLDGPDGAIEEGTVRVLRVGPFHQSWVAVHDQFVRDEHFRDYQRSGPFKSWEHQHRFLAGGVLSDAIDCRLPFGFMTQLPARELAFKPMFERMFVFRHLRTRFDLQRQREGRAWGSKVIAVAGSSGMIGRELCAFLASAGHQVVKLVRRAPHSEDERQWDPTATAPEPGLLDGVDAVVHLGGENLASGLWTAARKRAIRESRIQSTRLLARAIREADRPPEVFVVMSGVNAYGSGSSSELFSESSPLGNGFLAEVCREWEASAREASPIARVVSLRTGMVLSLRGGALPKLALPNWLGLGTVLGSGRQGVSWVGLEDLIGILYQCLWGDLEGPVNAVSPYPVTFAQLARTLARITHRPLLFRVPAPLLRIALGELATVVTEGNFVQCMRLQQAGFEFFYPKLEQALRHEMGLYIPDMHPPGWHCSIR